MFVLVLEQVQTSIYRENEFITDFLQINDAGLTFADLAWIRRRPWKIWDKKNPPLFLQTAKGVKDKGDMYLEPEGSVVYLTVVHNTDLS